jgi:hypothetical protein
MVRSFSFVALALTLLVSGCHWDTVAYQPQPAAVANPAGEIKTLLGLRSSPASVIEVTDDAIKEFFVTTNHTWMQILPFAGARFLIITRDNTYLVVARDGDGSEVWTYSPPARDLATCERMMNALYAQMKRQP